MGKIFLATRKPTFVALQVAGKIALCNMELSPRHFFSKTAVKLSSFSVLLSTAALFTAFCSERITFRYLQPVKFLYHHPEADRHPLESC